MSIGTLGNEEKCQSFKKRHGIVVEYIPIITKEPHLIAIKMWPEWNFDAIMRTGEFYNRTIVDKKHKLNLRSYHKIPQAWKQSLKLQEKFNWFKC